MPLAVPPDAGEDTRRAYDDGVRRILAIVATLTIADLTAGAPRSAVRLRGEVDQLVGDMDRAGRRALAAELADAEQEGARYGRRLLDTAGLRPGPSPPSPVDVSVTGEPPDRYLAGATGGIATAAVAAHRQAVADPDEAQGRLFRFADVGVAGRDSAGRAVELASYGQTVAVNGVRDTLGGAALGAVYASPAAGGEQLVRVPGPLLGSCRLCIPWEGRILAVTGSVGRYPSLAMAQADGLHHPHCRHAVEPYHQALRQGAAAAAGGVAGAMVGAGAPADVVATQRYLERGTRQWARRRTVALDGDAEAYTEARRSSWQQRLDRFRARFGLARRPAREG